MYDKPTEHPTPRLNPNASYGLWVPTACQCKLLNHNKFTALPGDVDNQGDCAQRPRAGQVHVVKPLYFLLSFPINLKLPKKINS